MTQRTAVQFLLDRWPDLATSAYALGIAYVGILGLLGSESGSVAEVTVGMAWVSVLFSVGHIGAGLTLMALSCGRLRRSQALTLGIIAALTLLHAWMIVDAADWSHASRQTATRLAAGAIGLAGWAGFMLQMRHVDPLKKVARHLTQEATGGTR